MGELLPLPSHDEPTKTCKGCGVVAPLSAFYKQPKSRDGRSGKCKTCTKRQVRANRAKRWEQYAEYERERTQRPERKAQLAAQTRRHREVHPDRVAARWAVNNAVRDGRLTRKPCIWCGSTENIQAHHHDYSKPLDVEWVCFTCHRRVEHGQKVAS